MLNHFRHVVVSVCAEADNKVYTVAFVVTVPVVVNVMTVNAVIVVKYTLEVREGMFVEHVIVCVEST